MNKSVFKSGQKLTISEFKNLKMIQNSEVARSISTKLIKDKSNSYTNGSEGTYIPTDGVLNELSKNTAINIEDVSNIFQTLPDIKIAMEIWTSCILSPNDGMTENLIWSFNNNNHEYNSSLFGAMLDKLKDYFENEYDILKHVRNAIEDGLFKTGSYPLVIVPESSVDSIINGKSALSNETLIETFYVKDTEGYKSPSIGVLGNPDKVSRQNTGLESLIHNPTVRSNQLLKQIHANMYITDNPDALKLHKALAVNQKKIMRKSISNRYGLEGYAKVDLTGEDEKVTPSKPCNSNAKPEDKEISSRRFDKSIKNKMIDELYSKRAYTPQKVVRVNADKDNGRMSIGHPLVLKVPSSSIIPVHVPGNPSDVVGAFIILDEYGNPLDNTKNKDLFDESRASSEDIINSANNVIKQMNFFEGGTLGNGAVKDDSVTFNELARSYGSLFEEDLLSRFANGLYGDNVEITRTDELYRIMLARACANMKTQVLYVQGELLTYFAFDYNDYGIGKSLLDDGRILATMRATMLYADIYSSLQNSIGRRKLRVTLDEDTPDVNKALETVRSEYLRATSWNLPLMNEGPVDAINILREGAVDFELDGDIPSLPATRIDVEDIQTSRVKPDDDLQEQLRNLHISSLGLPPTLVDETQQTEFATTALNAHSLFNKRVVKYQNIVNDKLLYDHITKYVLNSGKLIKELAYIIKDYKHTLTDEQRSVGNAMPIIEDFLDSLSVTLPVPEGMMKENQQKNFDDYKSYIENMVDAITDTSLLDNFMPTDEDGNTLDIDVGMTLKSILIRKYITENGLAPEIDNLLESWTTKGVTNELVNYLKPIVELIRQNQEAVKELTGEDVDADGNDSGDYGSDDDDTGDSGFGDDDGDDSDGEADMGDEDMEESGDEEASDEEEVEEEEAPVDPLKDLGL